MHTISNNNSNDTTADVAILQQPLRGHGHDGARLSDRGEEEVLVLLSLSLLSLLSLLLLLLLVVVVVLLLLLVLV